MNLTTSKYASCHNMPTESIDILRPTEHLPGPARALQHQSSKCWCELSHISRRTLAARISAPWTQWIETYYNNNKENTWKHGKTRMIQIWVWRIPSSKPGQLRHLSGFWGSAPTGTTNKDLLAQLQRQSTWVDGAPGPQGAEQQVPWWVPRGPAGLRQSKVIHPSPQPCTDHNSHFGWAAACLMLMSIYVNVHFKCGVALHKGEWTLELCLQAAASTNDTSPNGLYIWQVDTGWYR
jgi:hypothetical protein